MCSFVDSNLEWILGALTIIIFIFLVITSKKQGKYFVACCFFIVLILGILAHYYVINQIPSTMEEGKGVDKVSIFSAIVLSFISSSEMFLGGSKIFDNGFQNFLFSKNGTISLICISFLNVVALALSASVVFRFFFIRLASKWKLPLLGIFLNPNTVVHIFFGDNMQSRTLAKEISGTSSDEKVLIIDFPSDEDMSIDTDVFNRLVSFFNRKRKIESIEHLKANADFAHVTYTERRFDESLGLRGLDEWLFRQNTNIYFLSDNETDNLKCIKVLKQRLSHLKSNKELENKKVGRVFCHAKSDGENFEIQSEYRDDFYLTFVDSSFLSIRQIIREDFQSLPINYVDIAAEKFFIDKSSNMTGIASLGYVCSEFNAAILGFGELGQHAFSFLYQYGAFSGINKKRSPFHITAYDKEMNNLKPTFQDRYPGLGADIKINKLIKLETANLENPDFFSGNAANQLYQKINYYVICTGSDSRNVSVAKRLIKGIEKNQKHPKHLRIMIKHSSPDTIRRSVLETTRETELRKSIAFFGDVSKIWRMDIITDRYLENEAKVFSEKYEFAASALSRALYGCSDMTIEQARQVWTERERKLADPNQTDRNNLIRLLSQDLANTMHQSTKLAILGKYFREHAESLSTSIPDKYNSDTAAAPSDERHCDYELGSREAKILLYLAVGEKLRWNASHIMLGYKYDKKKDYTAKTHNCLTDYDLLVNGGVRHYDWLVVKTTLDLYCSRLKNSSGYSSKFSLIDNTNFVVKIDNTKL